MFSANENLALRQHKKRVVEYVESCIPEEALDMGTMVMVMQVSCKAPGCVPLETAIVIVFPKLNENNVELIPGLAESKGQNYKTKVLKPMAEVTKEDVLEALPPEFPGGKRSMEKLCTQARDVMLGQITQLFADEDQQGRQLMAKYLQECLQEYLDRDCTPPEWGEPFPPLLGTTNNSNDDNDDDNKANNHQKKTDSNAIEKEKSVTAAATTSPTPILNATNGTTGFKSKGNFVFKRPIDNNRNDSNNNSSKQTTPSGTGNTNHFTPGFTRMTTTSSRPATAATSRTANNTSPSVQSTTTNNNNNNNNRITTSASYSQSIIAQLGERQHAPGIRRPGCPCCDPDNADNLIDEMMSL